MTTLSAFWNKASALPDERTRFLIAFLSLLLFAALAFFFHEVVWGNYLGLSFPQPYLGELPSIFANDVTRLMQISADFSPYKHLHTYIPVEAVPYPPVAFLFYGILAQFGLLYGAALFYALFLGGSFLFFWKALRFLPLPDRLLGMTALTFGAFPFFYLLDRANLDGLSTLALAFAFLAYDGKKRNLWPALLVGLAGALKIYPLLFALTFLKDRNWKAFFFALFACAAMSFGAMALLHDPAAEQVRGFLGELRWTESCFSSYRACPNLSLLVPLGTVLHFLTGGTEAPALFKYLFQASNVGLLVLVSCVLFFWRPRLPISLTLLAIACLYIPAMSFNYKLYMFVLPFLLLLREGRSDSFFLALLLGCLLAFKRMWGGGPELLLNHALLITAFLWCLLISFPPFKDKGGAFGRALVAPIFIGLAFMLIIPYPLRTAWALSAHPVQSGTVTFTAQGRAFSDSFFGSHWGPKESDGKSVWRWMTDCESSLHLRLARGNSYRLDLTVSTHAKNARQEVSVFYKNTFLGRQSIAPESPNQLTFVIPASTIPHARILPDRLFLRTTQCNPVIDGAPQGLGLAFSRLVVAKVLDAAPSDR